MELPTNLDKKLISYLSNLPSDYWNFQCDDVREYSHGIHGYPAMMVSLISRNIIKLTNSIYDVNSVLDPFVGSGTVLVESMLAGINSIYGCDINPFALYLSKVKTTLLNIPALQEESAKLRENIENMYVRYKSQIEHADDAMRQIYGLDLSAKHGWGSDAPKYLEKYKAENYFDIDIPQFKNLGYWFKPKVVLILSLIKREINNICDRDIRDFIFIAFSEAIRLVSNRRNGEFKMFRMPADKVNKFDPDVKNEFFTILYRNIQKMAEFESACQSSNSTVSIYNNNAMSLEDIPDSSIDLVITSPPYGDSRTTVAYGEYSRLSLEWLDLFDLSDKEIRGIDKILLGGQKYSPDFKYDISSRILESKLTHIKNVDLNRARDVYSFYADLEKAIAAISRKSRPNGYQFWVVGNRTVRGELLDTDKIIAEIAEKHGLIHIYTFERNIINKVMPSLNSPSNVSGVKSSTMTKEHIVIKKKKKKL